MEPNWQNLPHHFKIDVVKLLDEKSRLSLSLCSKSDYEVTSAVPFFFDTVSLVKILEVMRYVNCFIQNHSSRVAKHHFSFETTISSFSNLVKHSKSRISHLTFAMDYESEEFYSMLVTKLEEKNLKIRAEKLTFNWIITEDFAPFVLKLLELMDTEVLKTLHFSAILMGGFWNQLKRTDQWKSLNGASLNVGKLQNVNLNDFLHLNQLHLKGFKNLNDDDKMKIIENFKRKNPPVPNSFFIVSPKPKNYGVLVDIRTTTEEFEMESAGFKLSVEHSNNFLEKEIRGRVIENGQDVSFNQLLYQMHT